VVAFQGGQAACWGLDLARQVGYVLRERGETRPVPILGGFVAEARPAGQVHVFWRLPGPPLFAAPRRLRNLRRYEGLLRSWGMATELCLDAPEPHLACWIAAG
jgi:hypothetical protein